MGGGGGNNNMTADTYGYNVNSMISYSEAKCLPKKQTNIYEVDGIELSQAQQCGSTTTLAKRKNVEGFFSTHLWPVYL